MPIPTCEKGHYFNTDMYGDECPICKGKLIRDEHNTPLKEELEVKPHDWVCGWLVCIKGLNKGRDFRIRPGYNFIGGSKAMDIIILGDPFVEDEKHACIFYDSRSRSTMLLPGTSRGISYLENQAVYEPTELKDFDTITIGETELRYAPFCGSDFVWEDQDNENKPR